MMRRRHVGMSLWAVVLAILMCMPGVATAKVGLSAFDVSFLGPNGEAVTQAGGHPYELSVSLRANTVQDGGSLLPDEAIKDVEVFNVPGFAGDPTAVPPCPTGEFFTLRPRTPIVPECPNSSAVGVATLEVGSGGAGTASWDVPVYNISPAPGTVAKLGFYVQTVAVTLDLNVSETPPYRIVAHTTNVSQALEFYSARIRLWGVPADPSHDPERGACEGALATDCPAEVSPVPFLTSPRACQGPLTTGYAVDSWEHPGSRLPNGEPNLQDPLWVSGQAVTHGDEVVPGPKGFSGCGLLGFSPDIGAQPTTGAADSASGLNFSLDTNDEQSYLDAAEGAVADSDVQKAVVTLPEGFTVNPSSANGLAACSEVQLGEMTVSSPAGVGCPNASKLGSVEVETPLLKDKVLRGDIYLATPFENQFGTLIAIYVVIQDNDLGISIKQPLKVEPNPVTGQLVTTSDEMPQLPFSHFRLHFREGPRSPLATPASCGTHQTNAVLYPWSGGAPVSTTSAFEVVSGPGGSGCPAAGALPFAPRFEAGTTGTQAGAYAPLLVNVNRNDGEQELKSLEFSLPKGLTGKLAGIPYCPEAAIREAEAKGGRAEQASPSCPAGSRLGSVDTAAGVGPAPIHVAGSVYLAGPYKGAPLSSVVVTPAVAGPFDLGDVVIRAPLFVDPETAEITAKSDPIPTILKGIRLKVRSVAIDLDRPGFTLNPTSCEPMTAIAALGGSSGATARPSNRFQVGGCNQLRFKPKLKISLKGSTKHIGHPALKAVVTYPQKGAYANIARAQVNLPHSEFLDQGNLNKTCTKPVLLAGKCPKKSIYGHAKAWTPLLERPLQGPVYLVGGYGYKLPALVAELNGQIRVVLKGKVDSGPNKGIRSTFEAVPDAPVSRFVLEMKGGRKYGLLENSENLCRKPQRAIARFTAQNGKVDQYKPRIANSCKRKHKRHQGTHKHTGAKHPEHGHGRRS